MSKLKPAFQPFLMLAPLGGLFLLSAVRMAEIHVGDGEAESRAANLQVEETIAARRGEILDVNGRVLATDRPVWELYVVFDPQRVRLAKVSPQPGQDEVTPEAYMAAQLEVLSERLDWFSEATGLSRESLKYAELGYPKDTPYFRALESGFTYAESRRLAAALKSMHGTGLKLRKSWERVYPQGRTFAHMLGFTTFNRDSGALIDDDLDDFARVGMQGLERVHDAELRGLDGTKSSLSVKNGFGVNPALELRAAVPGITLKTTLDARLGARMRSELATLVDDWDPDSCAVLVMDVKTGALLGVEALPDFDCNAPGQSLEFGTDQAGNRIPLGLSFPVEFFPPGSTVKPFVVARALETGAIQRSQRFPHHNGRLVVPGRGKLIGNARGIPNDWSMNAEEALVFSANVAMAQIGLEMEPLDLCAVWEDAGYTTRLDLPILGNKPSRVPGREDYLHPRKARPFTIPSSTYGAEQAFSPLHHLSAWQGFLNDGMRLKPRLSADAPVEEAGRVCGAEVAREVRSWLEGVVRPRSRGVERVRPHLDVREGLRWGGKSGSEDVDSDGNADLCIFVGFAPIENPEVVVLVIVDKPGGPDGARVGDRIGGSGVAGPTAGRIVGHALELRGMIEPLTNLESVASRDTLPVHVAR